MFKHRFQTLDCGLPLIIIPMPGVKSVTTLLLCNTGSRYEDAGKEGIAHFFEHMPAKGTKNYPNAFTFSSTLDAIGADFNAYTSKEYTGYYVHAASQHVALALDVVSDMVLAPLLKQEDIDVERGVIVEEINMYADMPAHHIANLFEQMFFSNSGLGHDIIGSKETVMSFKSSDFRDFLAKWYGLGNMLLIIAGDEDKVGKSSLLEDINKLFENKNKAKITGCHVKPGMTAEKNNLDKWLSKDILDKKLHLEYKKTEQAHFVMGWPGIARADDRRYALSLLSTIMGGNMSSRLFTEVREKRGLCYYVHSDMDTYHDLGVFGASAGVDPTRVEEAVKVTVEEFYKINNPKSKIDSKELQKAKDYVAGKMVLGLEDSQSVASYFGMRQLLQNKIETPEEVLAKIKAVNLEEIHAVAENLIKEAELRFAVIGPYKDQETFAKFLD